MTTVWIPGSPTRAAAFIAQCKEQGFTASQTVFLAEQHALLDRDCVRSSRKGTPNLLDTAYRAQKSASQALAQVQTPQQLDHYRENWLLGWVKDIYPSATQEEAFTVFKVLHDPQMQALVLKWQDLSQCLNEVADWDTALQRVQHSMGRQGLEVPPVSHTSLAQAAKEVGLHTLSWSTWRGEGRGYHAQLAAELLAFNAGLQQTTGLKGPLLGLGEGVRLHLDEDSHKKSSAQFGDIYTIFNAPECERTNKFGSSRIVLSPDWGYACLPHEWAHAFDYHMGNPLVCLYASDQEGPVARCIEGLKEAQTPLADMQEAAAAQLQSIKSVYDPNNDSPLFEQMQQGINQQLDLNGWQAWVKQQTEAGQHDVLTVSLGLLGAVQAQALGECANVWETWITLDPTNYYNEKVERFAYGFELSLQKTQALPTTCSHPVLAFRNASPVERENACQAFQTLFSSPEIENAWHRYTQGTTSPLVDAVQARRNRRQARSAAKAHASP